ncbi:undecaprenyldiphospho-muramoylpentapeptide beta-N-acetylglucosaminyltransferase [Campylobacter novaezeelandiae]|uniref:UDP-N-acetylglucosamine--N-acetylmuramyl-(pentapeptide) pyrophosphoryl-undecaprenol N-acetylglucosamine transferase n=2 Tax=Campylobacter novaezeelandiae TaxID=2267891 RepID=A0A4Q9JW51_9BACT|nr:undecaprenyldiphospho-muramoylpentapeptide beta-N-acetylglucosaminyltransferase [Campylobacter novaezeelandiae]MBK1993446.1 undecaprenyldiphospho-muramoylpentapeptide beta-N-acetylglucosaminyltransferase [Campylobacter novaezeelandiae]TBR81582.1 undecaprenyldiphospho-muramoylpentapeptide beta-N-acetylglucosaminyltransferase [Campylobacter novaezeelandiae]TBR82325.1 undecaprenyldiphospho-muramoylpentapeptide beta-N-acetylglucosaminyltransferase [Campylobacter novaezeelandiae]
MIAITGGGTGGHLNIAKCLLQSAKKQNIECIYIGSTHGQDKLWFENELDFKAKYFLDSKGVVNQKKMAKFKSLFKILQLSTKCREIFKEHQIKAVFSVGGYSSAPASFGAIINHIPLFIHEQNSKKGALNSLLKPFSKAFFSSFEPIFCSYPIDEKFFQTARIRKELKTIIFLGGSQGASFINSLALNLAIKLNEKGIKIIHQCGKNELELCKKKYEQLDIKVDLFAFDNNISAKIEKADLAISRSGASTLFELCASTIPAIFIPYPYAAKDHQFFNAKFLKDQNLCEIFLQSDLDEEKLLQAILNLNLEKISTNLTDKIKPNGADELILYVKNTINL